MSFNKAKENYYLCFTYKHKMYKRAHLFCTNKIYTESIARRFLKFQHSNITCLSNLDKKWHTVPVSEMFNYESIFNVTFSSDTLSSVPADILEEPINKSKEDL